MMKVKKSIAKKILLICLIGMLCMSIFCVSYFFGVTATAHVDDQKLNIKTAASYQIFDNNQNSINSDSITGSLVSFHDLQKHTVDAFVCIEDKRFFSHHGIDYIRILGAIKHNIFHPNSKQGGSTITQQVIKNTHLSNKKTIKRKLVEMKLAKELEKRYSKNEILEMYLNSIYFGNGCYGISKASKYYFDKQPSELSVAESALLASTINAPSIYDPIKHPDKTNARKNLVLNLMKQENKIDEKEYLAAISEKINIVQNSNNSGSDYHKYVIQEACKLLHVTENTLSNMNAKIYTYFDKTIQDNTADIVSKSAPKDAKYASIVLDNKTKGIVAICASKGFDPLDTKRQPGSLIKPIMVYAPAFECGKYAPATFVSDSKKNFGNYSPENANKKYLGEVSVRTAIEKSLNIPAVSILEDIGTTYAKSFAQKLGITFNKNDNNLALALGGFTDGLTLKQLSDAYMCFASSGNFEASAFIDKIELDGKVVYNRNYSNYQAISPQTCFLVNSCLCSTAKQGTAKRLNLNFEVASKTGTVGNSDGNTDAYNCAYTPMHTICTWMGTTNNAVPLSSSISGATYPTTANGNILRSIYLENLPTQFDIPEGIILSGLNDKALLNKQIVLDDTGEQKEYFAEKFLPAKIDDNSDTFEIVINNFENQKPIIKFDAKRANLYQIYRKNGSKMQLLQNIMYFSGSFEFEDKSAISGEIYEYFVIETNQHNTIESNHIKLVSN